jgi:hypothetical protein
MSYVLVMVRVWIVGFTGWLGYELWYYGAHCRAIKMGTGPFHGEALACNWEVTENGVNSMAGQAAPLLTMLKDIALQGVGLPLCGLIVGCLLYWIVIRPAARA